MEIAKKPDSPQDPPSHTFDGISANQLCHQKNDHQPLFWRYKEFHESDLQ